MYKVVCRKFISVALIVTMFSLFACYIYKNRDQLGILFNLSTIQIFSIILLVGCALIARGIINTLFYRRLQIPLSFLEGAGLAIMNTLGNLLPLSGGLVAKGVYLKRRYRLQYSQYISATIALTICFIAVNGIVSLISIYFLFLLNYKVSMILVIGFLMMTSAIVLVRIPINLKFLPSMYKSHIDSMQKGWSILGRNVNLLLIVTSIHVLSLLFVAVRLLIMYRIFSMNVNYLMCMMLAGALVLTSFVNIIPGNLGVREGILGGISFLMGQPFEISAIVVAFDRIFAMAVVFLIGLIFSAIINYKQYNQL